MRVDEAIEAGASFAVAALSSLVLTVNVFSDAVHDARTSAMLVALIAFNAWRVRRLWAPRELGLYLAFFAYMVLSMLWTSDIRVAVDIIFSMMNFAFTLQLFTQLILYYELRVTLWGILAGLLVGAAIFTLKTHFPFVYPEGLSYNTVAGMYLFILIVAALVRLQTRARLLPPAVGLVSWAHIVASTSIKTNLGVALGLGLSALLQFGGAMRLLWRNLIPLLVLLGAAAYFVASRPSLLETLQGGLDRVSLGVSVLLNREQDTGATNVSTRENWKAQGLRGWTENPVFGHGAEAFRIDVGVTSHSTVVDLLYNTGLIGFCLFYGILGSVAWRWFRDRDERMRGTRAIMLGIVCCYTFISISGLMYYDVFLPAFVALAVGLKKRAEQPAGLSEAMAAPV